MPVRWRLTLFNAIAIGAILVVLAFAIFFLLRASLYSDIEGLVTDRATAAARGIEDYEDAEDATTGDDSESLTSDGVFILVRNRDGSVVSQSATLSAEGVDSDPVWRSALRQNAPVSGRASLAGESQDLISAVPVRVSGDDDSPSGTLVVEAGKSTAETAGTLSVFRRVLVAGVGAAFLLSLVGAYLLARVALSPVEAVVRAAASISDDDLSRRLPVARKGDEIGRLAATINALLARLEAAFARREEALERQRRFVADASHELRTPLTSIDGYARMLENWGLEDPERAREGVEAIRSESGRMRGLVEGLLLLARGEEGPQLRPERCNLSKVAGEAVESARAASDGKVGIELVVPEETVEATFDRERVREVVSVLLDNAVKYTPGGGHARVRVFEEGEATVLEVEDDGVGIPPEHLPLVFERFHRVDDARDRGAGGYGLGLSIARQVAEAHGGSIEARSEPGRGSTFTLRLPKSGILPEEERL